MIKSFFRVKKAEQDLPKYKRFIYAPNELMCIYSTENESHIDSVVTYLIDEKFYLLTNRLVGKAELNGKVLYIYGENEGKVAEMKINVDSVINTTSIEVNIEGVPPISIDASRDKLVTDSNANYMFESLNHHNKDVFSVVSKDALLYEKEERLSYDAIKNAVKNHNKKVDVIHKEELKRQKEDAERRSELESLF